MEVLVINIHIMKRLILILTCVLCLTACTKTVYVDSETGKPVNVESKSIQTESFIDLETIVENSGFFKGQCVYRDRHTDVLYFQFGEGYQGGITPIAKPDGTFLTYKEWKETR